MLLIAKPLVIVILLFKYNVKNMFSTQNCGTIYVLLSDKATVWHKMYKYKKNMKFDQNSFDHYFSIMKKDKPDLVKEDSVTSIKSNAKVTIY